MSGIDNPVYSSGDPGIFPSSASFASITTIPTDITISVDKEDVRYRIKPEIQSRQIVHFRRKLVRQTFYALTRNALCYLFVFSSFVLVANSQQFSNWSTTREALTLLAVCVGLVGPPAQIVHVIGELRSSRRRRTTIARMLATAVYRTALHKLLRVRQLAAPYVAIDIALVAGIISCDDPSHWTRTARRTSKTLAYNAAGDRSGPMPVAHTSTGGGGYGGGFCGERATRASWLLVVKDYRWVDSRSQKLAKQEVDQFSVDSLYDRFRYRMRRQYVLDVTEGDEFPDVQPFLVFDGKPSIFYSWGVYKIAMFACVDSVYHVLFRLLTFNQGNYFIVKYLEL